MPFFKTVLFLFMLAISGFFAPVFSGPALAGTCVADATTLCLNGNRFQIELDWLDQAGNEFTIPDIDQSGSGQAVGLSDDTGFFWIFGSEHNEVMIKVVDGCGINARFWVFAAATTNVEYSISVTDTNTGISREYFNPLGTASPAITDTDAFATCDGSSGQMTSTDSGLSPIPDADAPSCMADATTMCMHGNRFRVTVEWRDFLDNTGMGRPVNLGDQTGYFWFFVSNNVEMVFNIINGKAKNGYFWVYFSATTNVEYTVSVTDTVTGQMKQYSSTLGLHSPAVLDNMFGAVPPPPPVPVMNSSGRAVLILMFVFLGFMVIRAARASVNRP